MAGHFTCGWPRDWGSTLRLTLEQTFRGLCSLACSMRGEFIVKRFLMTICGIPAWLRKFRQVRASSGFVRVPNVEKFFSHARQYFST